MKTKIENGIEYTQHPNSNQWLILFELDDGQKFTVTELSEKINCNLQCARARLKRTSDPKLIFAPLRTLPSRMGNTKPKFAFDPSTWFEDPLVKLMLK